MQFIYILRLFLESDLKLFLLIILFLLMVEVFNLQTGRDTVWPHDPRTGWSYCVSIPSWTVQPELGSSDSLNNPIVVSEILFRSSFFSKF